MKLFALMGDTDVFINESGTRTFLSTTESVQNILSAVFVIEIISMKANRIGLSSANFAASAMRWDRVRKRPWMETR